MINVGDKVKDPISGIKGVITARTEYLYGCIRVCLEHVKDGAISETWFDEPRLESTPATPKKALQGGGGANPPRRIGE